MTASTGTGDSSSKRWATLPKGLSEPTAEVVLTQLRAVRDLSAAECADEVGIARVTARRYLEHFVATGHAEVRHNHETVGRPERRYRAR